MSYKKVKTVFIFDKPKCIYMKPKGTREYVKSKGEMVLLSAYIKKAEKIAAKKALASKMAKKSKASRWPNKRRSIYGGFFDEEDKEVGGNEEYEYDEGKELEEQLQSMSGGQGFEELVSKENIDKLMSFLKTTGGKKVKRVSKAKKAKGPKKLKHVSSVALMKRRGIKRRGGVGGNLGEDQYND
jgi:hypothetical protein